MTTAKGTHRTIDDRIAGEIRELHKRFPKLGHHGILEALRDDGDRVDPEELKHFLKEHGIRAEKPWRPWRWRGLPSWLGGRSNLLK